MARRASLALVAALAGVLSVLGSTSPAAADAPARLAYAHLSATPFGSLTLLQLQLRVTGDAVRVDYEYDVTTGTIPTIRFTGTLPVSAAQLITNDQLPAFAPQGSYSLRVTVVAADGSTAEYRPDGHAVTCTPAHVCAVPVAGLTVLAGTGFSRSAGPASLAAVVSGAGRLTAADLTAPAINAHIPSGGTVAATLGFAGASTGSPPSGTSLQPFYAADGVTAFFAGPAVAAGSTSGSVVSSGAGPTSGSLWRLYEYVVRTGLVDRFVLTEDRAYLHTVWPLSATSLATMPAPCGIEPGLGPTTGCTLIDTAAAPLTGGGAFAVDGVRGYSAPWWTFEVSGGSADASHVVSDATHPITFTVHYKGLANPQSQPVSMTVGGPGSSTLTAGGSGPVCPFAVATGYYECDLAMRLTGVAYNGTYRATSVTITPYGSPNLVCAPGPTAALTGYHLLDTTSPASRAVQLCGGISWSSLSATVTGRSALPCSDTTPPVLAAFARSSATAFDATSSPTTGSASFHWAASDSGCGGLTSVSATFVRPDGVSWVATSTVPARASGSGTMTLTPQPGSWALRRVTVRDAAGNARYYDSDGVASGVVHGTATAWLRSPHSFDLASDGVRGTAGAPPRGVPAPPRALAVSRLGTSLALTWAPPVPSTGVTGYVATIRSAIDGTTITRSTGTGRTTFSGLDPTVPYDVWVEAMHGPVSSPWTPLYGTLTAAASPLIAPPAGAPALRALPSVLRSSTLSLGVSPQVVPGYPVSGYVLQWSHATASAAMSAWGDRGAATSRPPSSITGFGLGTKVCVRVLAVNAVGRGPASATRCTSVALDDRSLTRSSGWSRTTASGAYRGTLSAATRRGAVLTFRATGHGLALLVRTRRGAGTLGVYVGAHRVAALSLASSSTRYTTISLGSRLTGAMSGQVVSLRVDSAGRAVEVDGVAVLP